MMNCKHNVVPSHPCRAEIGWKMLCKFQSADTVQSAPRFPSPPPSTHPSVNHTKCFDGKPLPIDADHRVYISPFLLCLYVYPHRFDVYANLSSRKLFPVCVFFFACWCAGRPGKTRKTVCRTNTNLTSAKTFWRFFVDDLCRLSRLLVVWKLVESDIE